MLNARLPAPPSLLPTDNGTNWLTDQILFSNSQSLNRYSYTYNNPIPYLIILGGAYLGGRVGYEFATLLFPSSDNARRDRIGGQLVMNVTHVIQEQADLHSVDPILIAAVLRLESAAIERRLLTLWPTMQPGFIANTAEFLQSYIQGDTASIGPAQMQLRRARELEEMGYVTTRNNDYQRRLDLLNEATSVEYVAGMLHYLSDQLNNSTGYNNLTSEQQQRLLLIAYNWGWTDRFQQELQMRGLIGMIEWWPYDNQTLDEYLRWSEE